MERRTHREQAGEVGSFISQEQDEQRCSSPGNAGGRTAGMASQLRW